jgi:hypothetical protein
MMPHSVSFRNELGRKRQKYYAASQEGFSRKDAKAQRKTAKKNCDLCVSFASLREKFFLLLLPLSGRGIGEVVVG